MVPIFTSDVDNHCYLLDRGLALAVTMLMGGLNDENFDAVLSDRIEEIRRERRRKLGANGALVIESWGDVEAKIEEPMRDFGEFLICFDPINKDAIKERHRQIVTTLIASLSLASSESHTVDTVAEGLYLIDEAGKIIHPRFPRAGGGTLIVSTPIEQQTVEAMRAYSTLLTDMPGLERVSSLYVQTINSEHDDFRRFVFGWTALEIFVGKVFKNHGIAFVDELVSGARTSEDAEYFERFMRETKRQYSLVDKFSVIATVLNDEYSDADIQVFQFIKGRRDNLFHGQEVPETSLPNTELQSLLSKYLRTYLSYISCS